MKANFFNHVYKKLMSILAKFRNKDYYIFKLPREFVIDVKIESNRKMMLMSIKDIFSLKSQNQNELKRIAHNARVMEEVKDLEFVQEISKTMKEQLLEYLASDVYQEDLQKLKKKIDLDYSIKYQKFATGFIEFCFKKTDL